MKIKNRIFLAMTVFFCAAIFFSSCDSDDPSKNRSSAIKKLYNSGKVKIAIANSFDQNLSKMWEGAVLAQEKINGEHMLPVQLELIKFNDGGDTIKGMSTAYKITSDPEICAVVGHGYSDVSLSCSLIYQYYGLLMFNFISTAHTLTDRNNPIIFSNMPRDVDFADEISLLCEKNGYKSVLIYYLENISGTSISNFFEISCSKRGISVVNRDSYDITTSQQEFERTIRRWKNNFMFDAIFLAGRMPSIQQIIVTLRDNGINCPIVGSDPFDDPLLTQNLSEKENGRIFAVSNFDIESQHPRFKEFCEGFKAKYDYEPDQEALQVYDALMVLAGAMQKAESANPEELADCLRHGFWNEAAGSYSFAKNGSVQHRKLTAKVFKDGKFVKIED